MHLLLDSFCMVAHTLPFVHLCLRIWHFLLHDWFFTWCLSHHHQQQYTRRTKRLLHRRGGRGGHHTGGEEVMAAAAYLVARKRPMALFLAAITLLAPRHLSIYSGWGQAKVGGEELGEGWWVGFNGLNLPSAQKSAHNKMFISKIWLKCI